jgi:tetratricopeptide (TPR) repeat protein
MKAILIFFLVFSLYLTTAAQQPNKIDDALLLDYYQSQRFMEAVDYLKKNFPEPITDPKVLSSLAYSSQMVSKLPEAESYYRRVFEMDTTNQSALLSIASINLRRGNHSKAEVYYKRALLKDTTNFVVYKQLAFLSAYKYDTVSAVGYLKKANTINPYDSETAGELSDFYTAKKQFELAFKVLNKVAENDPDDVFILMSMMKLTYSEKKWIQTVAVCNKLLQIRTANGGDGPHGEVLNKLGIAYYNLKNYACGAESFADIGGMEQDEYTFYYAAMCYKGLKDNIQAIGFMNKAIFQGISPNIARYYGEIADSNEQLSKYKKAVKAYIKGLQFSEDPTMYYLLANLYDTQLKDKHNAAKYYKKYLSFKLDAKQLTYITYAKSRLDALKN